MTEAQSTGDAGGVGKWPTSVANRIKSEGAWQTLSWLHQERSTNPDDLSLRGYVEILRVWLVKDFLTGSKGMKSVPRLTPAFLSDFDKFALSAQEGYLISQIDGRTTLEKLLKVSPFDPFTTLFSLARMNQIAAIETSE